MLTFQAQLANNQKHRAFLEQMEADRAHELTQAAANLTKTLGWEARWIRLKNGDRVVSDIVSATVNYQTAQTLATQFPASCFPTNYAQGIVESRSTPNQYRVILNPKKFERYCEEQSVNSSVAKP